MLDIFERMKKSIGVSKDTELTKALNISNPSAVSLWRSRGKTPYQECEHIARKYSISLDWLITGEGSMYREPNRLPEKQVDDNMIQVAKIALNPSAGTGMLITDEDTTGFVNFGKKFLNNLNITAKKNLRIVKINGKSMSPTLENNEQIIIDVGVRNYSGQGIYVVRYDDEAFIKIVQKIDGAFHLVSDNHSYKTIIVDKSIDFEFLAKFVVGFKYL